jgi:hypothetical protein
MTKRNLLILGLVGLAAISIVVLMMPGKSGKKRVSQTGGGDDFTVFSSDKGYTDTIYPDAPLPFVEDPSLEAEAINLWPSAIRSVKDDKHREMVREQWKDFSTKYPSNVYVPKQYKAPITVEQEKEIRENLDIFASVDTFYARSISRSKYGEPGKEPVTSTEAGVTPSEQRKFFDYKIRELESRIQLIEYAKENNGLAEDQIPSANKEIVSLKKEIEKLSEVAKTVPNI